MSEKKKYYVVDFAYADNGQIFGSGANLTKNEKDRIESILDRYKEEGAVDSGSIHEPTEVDQDFDALVNEILEALKNEVPDSEGNSSCPNCDRVWPDAIMVPIEEVKNLLQRVSAGEPMPSGECPACGALCQPVEE